jgi:hypothetical protein
VLYPGMVDDLVAEQRPFLHQSKHCLPPHSLLFPALLEGTARLSRGDAAP